MGVKGFVWVLGVCVEDLVWVLKALVGKESFRCVGMGVKGLGLVRGY